MKGDGGGRFMRRFIQKYGRWAVGERCQCGHARAEHEGRPRARIYVWRNASMESTKAAIARRFPAGVRAGARIVICTSSRRRRNPSLD